MQGYKNSRDLIKIEPNSGMYNDITTKTDNKQIQDRYHIDISIDTDSIHLCILYPGTVKISIDFTEGNQMEKPLLTTEQLAEIDDMIEYRQKLNLSQKKFAEELGISVTTIRYVEQQRQPISMSLRAKIADHKKELKYHVSSMEDYQELLLRVYAGNEAAKRIVPLIVDHVSMISTPSDFKDKRKQTAYLNFLERTLAEYENVCKQVADQIRNEQVRDLSGCVAGLRKAILEQQNSAVKQYEK